jgi:sodium transport system ATP-binding protein
MHGIVNEPAPIGILFSEKYPRFRHNRFDRTLVSADHQKRDVQFPVPLGFSVIGDWLPHEFLIQRRDRRCRHIFHSANLPDRIKLPDCPIMIHVRQLTKTYQEIQTGGFTALDSVSFDAMPGQIFGLLGPNGAGKTTALRILSTVLRPTSGTVTVNGFDVSDQPDLVRHQIGFVSTNTAIYDRMSAWEMVHYFGQLYGMTPEELNERMEHLFARFQMNEIRDLLGSKMSTGMKQKVSIVRAMVHNPPVLIFDEATSGLDILVAREVLKTVEQVRDQGKCVIFSSHIMTEVRRLCDRVAIMNRGRILAQGSIEELSAIHQQDDLEELFYQLISESEKEHAASI